MWIRLLFLAGLLVAFPSASAQDSLPADTRRLASELALFERKERAILEAAIAEKRRKVLVIYQAQMERESKAGRLDSAMAIKGLIENLGNLEMGPVPKPEPTVEMEAEDSFEKAKAEFGAVEVTVPAEKNRDSPQSSRVRVSQGDTFVLIPHPADQWSGGGSKRGKFCDFRGYNPDVVQNPWMRLFYQVGNGEPIAVDPRTTVTASEDGFIRLFAEDADKAGNEGSVRVVVIPKK